MRVTTLCRLVLQLLVLLPFAVVAKKKDKAQPQAVQNATIDRVCVILLDCWYAGWMMMTMEYYLGLAREPPNTLHFRAVH